MPVVIDNGKIVAAFQYFHTSPSEKFLSGGAARIKTRTIISPIVCLTNEVLAALLALTRMYQTGAQTYLYSNLFERVLN